MRLKTVAAEEAHTSYRVPTAPALTQTKPRELYEERIEERLEEQQAPAQLKKVRQPLAHPKRVAGISAGFLLVLGGLHFLTVNNAPTYPRYEKARSNYFVQTDGPGVKEHLSAATSLLNLTPVQSMRMLDGTVAVKKAALAKNALPLQLIHTAAQQKANGEFRVGYEVPRLLLAQYDVALAEGKRTQALSALTDFVQLHTLERKGFLQTIYLSPDTYDALSERLSKTTFSKTETATLRAALGQSLQAEPDWKALAAQAKADTLGTYLPKLLSGKSDIESYYQQSRQNTVNWDTVINGKVLGEAIGQVQLQAVLFRYGSQGLVDACTQYLEAREKQVLLPPAEAQTVTVPPLPQIPGGELLDWQLRNITRQKETWSKLRAQLEKLQLHLGGE